MQTDVSLGGDMEQITYQGKLINCWDMSGDPKEGATCIPPLARICNAAFIVFDASRKETYSSLERWKQLLGAIPAYVLANKSDLAESEGADFAVSAKDNQGITQAFDALIAIARQIQQ